MLWYYILYYYNYILYNYTIIIEKVNEKVTEVYYSIKKMSMQNKQEHDENSFL